ncbi:molybdopterin synthase catalytic subunit [Rubricoccus marinus]|uniref:molybdopterin synthase catalytic subunit n=1 Tax=Rubricoccus marinus TaxID=716817 RepID=UPI000B9842E9|nr:molybdenum cofactor biosynthesis protein MoaE [Rubricoccus marinus]
MTPPTDTPIWTGLITPEADGLASGVLPVQRALDFLVPAGGAPEAGTVGGTCLFLGTTRRWTGNVETPLLSYQAYTEMAARELDRLALRAMDQWALARVVVLHRLGDVPSPEASVLCAASAAHRDAAFAACRWLIDTLKEDVPIWKQESDASGSTAWVNPLET